MALVAHLHSVVCSYKGDVSSRPSWAGGALSWGLNLASFEGVPIQLTGFEMEHVQMLRSLFVEAHHWTHPGAFEL